MLAAFACDRYVLAALAELQGELSASGRAFQIVERINGWTLVSDPACWPTWTATTTSVSLVDSRSPLASAGRGPVAPRANASYS